jgi:HEAT repeat protein
MKNRTSLVCTLLFTLLTVIGTACGPAKANIEKLRADLKSPDSNVRQEACAELAKAKQNAAPALPDLIAALNDTDPIVRRLAAYALGEMGSAAKSAVPELQKHVADPDLSVMQNVGIALRSITGK